MNSDSATEAMMPSRPEARQEDQLVKTLSAWLWA